MTTPTEEKLLVDQPLTDLSISIDVAQLVANVIWPLLLLVLFLLLRKQMPNMFKGLLRIFNRAEKISIGNFSMEMAKVQAIKPQWTPTDSSMDIRKSMSSAEVSDSTASHFTTQLNDTTPAEFALVDLGDGREWLSSRLYIISILLTRAKGIKAIVFVRTAGKRSKRLLGWAEPETIRWSLAQKFPWLEDAFASSYATLFRQQPDADPITIVTRNGMLGIAQQGASASLIIQLLQVFLQEIQSPTEPNPVQSSHWEKLQANVATWEHACMLNVDDIEDILGDDLNKQFVYEKVLDSASQEERVKRLLQAEQNYIPIVDEYDQFRELIDREIIASQVLLSISRG